jgi:hypothetical protein
LAGERAIRRTKNYRRKSSALSVLRWAAMAAMAAIRQMLEASIVRFGKP